MTSSGLARALSALVAATVLNACTGSDGSSLDMRPSDLPIVRQEHRLDLDRRAEAPASPDVLEVATHVILSPAAPTIMLPSNIQFSAMATLSTGGGKDVTKTATWTSSNTKVATVTSGGLATGLQGGTTVITAAALGAKGSTSLSVVDAKPYALEIAPPAATVTVGSSVQLTATLRFSDGTALDVTAAASWSTTDPALTSIISPGLCKGLGLGSATVTAAHLGFQASASVTVK